MTNLFSTIPEVFNVTLTVADSQYTQDLPDATKRFTVQCRTANDVRFAFVTGKVAGPVAPYETLKSNQSYYEDNLFIEDTTIYLASSIAGVVVEIIIWK